MFVRRRLSRPKPQPQPKNEPCEPKPKRNDATNLELPSPSTPLSPSSPLIPSSSFQQQRQTHQRHLRQLEQSKPPKRAHLAPHPRPTAQLRQAQCLATIPSDNRNGSLSVLGFVSAEPDHGGNDGVGPPIGPSPTNNYEVLCDLVSTKFNRVISSIDGESFKGDEEDLGK